MDRDRFVHVLIQTIWVESRGPFFGVRTRLRLQPLFHKADALFAALPEDHADVLLHDVTSAAHEPRLPHMPISHLPGNLVACIVGFGFGLCAINRHGQNNLVTAVAYCEQTGSGGGHKGLTCVSLGTLGGHTQTLDPTPTLCLRSKGNLSCEVTARISTSPRVASGRPRKKKHSRDNWDGGPGLYPSAPEKGRFLRERPRTTASQGRNRCSLLVTHHRVSASAPPPAFAS